MKKKPSDIKKKPSPANVPSKAAPKIKAAPKSKAGKSPEPGEDNPGLGDIMAGLSKIFGGREFSSDADLDAFLESKIASGEIPPSADLDPLDEAQSLIYEAWNTEGPEKIQLAHRALELSDKCADAYILLAEETAKSLPSALALYRKGVDAAKRALDPSIFSKSVGEFWEIMETRPYMRARFGLAECLLNLGKQAESVEHLNELLRLNPSDNQGARFILIQCLLASNAEKELGKVLASYPKDESPEMRYTHALWLFRQEGPTKSAGAMLTKAISVNPHVPAYLLKRKKLPKDAPESTGHGTVEAAEAYVSGGMDPWIRTKGALEWLAESVSK